MLLELRTSSRFNKWVSRTRLSGLQSESDAHKFFGMQRPAWNSLREIDSHGQYTSPHFTNTRWYQEIRIVVMSMPGVVYGHDNGTNFLIPPRRPQEQEINCFKESVFANVWKTQTSGSVQPMTKATIRESEGTGPREFQGAREFRLLLPCVRCLLRCSDGSLATN